MLRLFGPAVDEIGPDLKMQYRAWKWRRDNVEALADKHRDEVNRRGLDPEKLQPLPEGDAFRAMEAASMEDDDTVQKLWAGLLTSAMDPDNPATASKVFVDLLKSIGPTEVGLLLVLYKMEIPIIPAQKTAEAVNEEIARVRALVDDEAKRMWRHFDHESRQNAVQNLMRLRCIGFRTGKQLSEHQLMAFAPFGIDRRNIPAKAEAVAKALDYLENLALAVSGTGNTPWPSSWPRSRHSRPRSTDMIPESVYQLTSLGQSLMRACLDAGKATEERNDATL